MPTSGTVPAVLAAGRYRLADAANLNFCPQCTRPVSVQVKQDAGKKESTEDEPSAGGDEEYDCVVLLLLSAITEWCSWALPAAYAQVCPHFILTHMHFAWKRLQCRLG